ncbi:hypothetical protein HHL22_12010 [Hymenobacter sp. RP-2-7]|uniref:Uncharacterized protein n=1 Tax=Hymenobacter polaris TaxID=2682546 RepID=A0A7Y0AEN7_9BACT|nr:hypothetical protein [Hymenobacter polaris]NML65931.1 hypothetical protein [Hymenobacter polaris]
MVRIAGVRPMAAVGAVRAQVALGDWLLAEVQAPAGTAPAELARVFAVGEAWPLVGLPAGYRLLGYLDPREDCIF